MNSRALGYAIGYSDSLIVAPTVEWKDIEEIKKQRRFASTSLDTLFDLWTSAARQHFEEMTSLQLLTATRCFALDSVPCQSQIQLGRAPVQSIVSVTYDDESWTEQTFDDANYRLVGPNAVDVYPALRCIELVSGASWPTGTGAKSLRINYLAGYGDAPGAVPEIIQYALMCYVGAFHKFGEELSEEKYTCLPIGAQMVIRNAKALRTLVPRSTWLG